MRKTKKLIYALAGTLVAGTMTGCSPDVAYEQPSSPPQIPGYEEQYWEWDEEDGEWEYNPPGGGGPSSYHYLGKLYKKSIKNSGLKSSAAIKSGFSAIKSGGGKMSGFGGGFGGGGFGG